MNKAGERGIRNNCVWDENGNSWSVGKWSAVNEKYTQAWYDNIVSETLDDQDRKEIEEAVNEIISYYNLKECGDCKDCENCSGCYVSNRLKYCTGCDQCNDCEYCNNCEESNYLVYCNNCDNSNHLAYCNLCNRCNDCDYCNDIGGYNGASYEN